MLAFLALVPALVPGAAAAEGGFNPVDPSAGGLALWTWIIFLIALPFMWKVVMGPVAKALAARDAQAAAAIDDAKRASEDAQRARAEVEQRLREAAAGAQRTMDEARARAEAREKELVDKAKAEAGAMLESARGAIRAEQEKALAAIRREVVDLSLSAASRVIARKVDSDDDRRLAAEVVAATGTASASGKPR
jgi:F-type H+-transporting ATPase subunit b